nr:uncharacterized protein LOC111753928 isoform X3 [Cavia porcellus]
MLAALSPVKLIGPRDVHDAARSVTVPVRANFLTARASTVSALRSSSDEDPRALPFGERPAPRAHVPPSLRALRTPLSSPWEPQMAGPAHQHWSTWLPTGQDSRPPGQLDCSSFGRLERTGARAPAGAPALFTFPSRLFEGEGGEHCSSQPASRNSASLEHQDLRVPSRTLHGFLVILEDPCSRICFS